MREGVSCVGVSDSSGEEPFRYIDALDPLLRFPFMACRLDRRASILLITRELCRERSLSWTLSRVGFKVGDELAE